MKRDTALRRLREMADKCQSMAGPAPDFMLRVIEFWVFGVFLDEPASTPEWVDVALVVDLPPDVAHWFAHPPGTEHWAYATRLQQSPLTPQWRPKGYPVWNHDIRRPLLLWDVPEGVREEAFAGLRTAAYEPLRLPEPSPEELRERLVEERGSCLTALKKSTRDYTEKRWGQGKIERIADPLHFAALGYLDILAALDKTDARPGTEGVAPSTSR
jgi:hypothetical protein